MEIANNFKDPSNTAKSISVIDVRSDKNPGTIKFKDETYIFETPQDLDAAFKNEFEKDNKIKGTKDIVFLLEDLKISENNTGKKIVPSGHIRASLFEKKGEQFYYLNTLDRLVGTLDVQNALTPKNIVFFLNYDVADFLKTSYSKQPSSIALSAEDLPNYFKILSADFPAFKQNVADGVYESHTAFFNQKPSEGFVLERNSEGKVTKARNDDQKLQSWKIWAYVENGKIFKNTYSGFLPMEKNDNGFYLFANRGELEMIQSNSTLGMFGLIGGIAAAVEQDVKQDKAKKAEKKEIYIDPLTGRYIY